MRRVLIVLGVLGSGTAATFLAAGAILLANPNGPLVANTYQGNPVPIMRGGPIALPMPVEGVVVDDTGVMSGPAVKQVIVNPAQRVFSKPLPVVLAPSDGANAP